jgi:hypothetical protein
MAKKTFMGAIRDSDRVKDAINSHPDVARSRELVHRAAGIHGLDSPQHKAALEDYRNKFQNHPRHGEYKEHIRRAGELEAQEKTKKLRQESVEMSEEKDDGEGALKYCKVVDGEWCLVSDHTGKTLKKFGKEKPSREAADKALRAVEYFKHGG